MPTPEIPAFMSWDVPAAAVGMWDWQKHRCAMCNERGLVVLDHDHDTGLTRGFLCRYCNMTEAKSGAAGWWLWRTGMNPARMFGWEETYISPTTGLPVIAEPERDDWRERAAAALDRPPRPSITADVYMGRKQGGKEAAEALDR